MIATVVGTSSRTILIIAEDATVPPSDIGGEDGVERPAAMTLRMSNDVEPVVLERGDMEPDVEDLPSSDERLDRS